MESYPVVLLTASIDDVRLGFPLASVERVVPACQTVPLPHAPARVIGALNLGGRVIAAFDLRQRLNLPHRPMRVDDQLLVVKCAGRDLALLIDDALDVVEYAADAIVPGAVLGEPMDRHVAGLVRLADGLLLIENPEHFLDARELAALDAALAADGHVA